MLLENKARAIAAHRAENKAYVDGLREAVYRPFKEMSGYLFGGGTGAAARAVPAVATAMLAARHPALGALAGVMAHIAGGGAVPVPTASAMLPQGDDDDGVVVEDDETPDDVEVGHAGPKASLADIVDLRGSAVESPAPSRGRRDGPAAEWTPVPLEPADAQDTAFANDVLLHDLITAAAPDSASDLQQKAEKLLKKQEREEKLAVRTLHDRLQLDGEPPLHSPRLAHGPLTNRLNSLIHHATLLARYLKTGSGASGPAALSAHEAHAAARGALQQLNRHWDRHGDGDFILRVLGESREQWFAAMKEQLAGTTCAQAKALLRARCEAALPHLAPLAKEVVAEACMDSLEPLLQLLPDSVLERMDWAGDRHLAYRMGYQAARATGLPAGTKEELESAANAVAGEFARRQMEDVGALGVAHDYASLSGLLGPDAQAQDEVLATVIERFKNRPSAVRDQKLGAIQAALGAPPRPLSEVAAEYARQHISGRDDVTAIYENVDIGTATRLNQTLLQALAGGDHVRVHQGADGNAYPKAKVLIEVEHSELGRKGAEVEINGEELYGSYMQEVGDYYHRAEQGAHAMLDLVFGENRVPVGFIRPQVALGQGNVIKSPEHLMIVMLRAQGAREPQPYRLEYQANRPPRLAEMHVSEEDIAAWNLDTPGEKALFYVRQHPAEFFPRAPEQVRAGTTGFERNVTGTPDEARNAVLSQLGWKQKLDAARNEAQGALQSTYGDLVIRQVPVVGCMVSEIQEILNSDAPAGTGAFDWESFKNGVMCGLEALVPGVDAAADAFPTGRLMARTSAAGSAGRKAARLFTRRKGHSQGATHADMLKSNRDAYLQGLPVSPGRKAEISAQLDRVHFKHSVRHFKDARELAGIAGQTTDGSTLAAGATLPKHALVKGKDGHHYLKAAGGEAGGIFLHTDASSNARIFVRNVGTTSESHYARVNLNTLEVDAGKTGFRSRRPDHVLTKGGNQAETAYYTDDGEVRVRVGGRLRKASPDELQDYQRLCVGSVRAKRMNPPTGAACAPKRSATDTDNAAGAEKRPRVAGQEAGRISTASSAASTQSMPYVAVLPRQAAHIEARKAQLRTRFNMVEEVRIDVGGTDNIDSVSVTRHARHQASQTTQEDGGAPVFVRVRPEWPLPDIDPAGEEASRRAFNMEPGGASHLFSLTDGLTYAAKQDDGKYNIFSNVIARKRAWVDGREYREHAVEPAPFPGHMDKIAVNAEFRNAAHSPKITADDMITVPVRALDAAYRKGQSSIVVTYSNQQTNRAVTFELNLKAVFDQIRPTKDGAMFSERKLASLANPVRRAPTVRQRASRVRDPYAE